MKGKCGSGEISKPEYDVEWLHLTQVCQLVGSNEQGNKPLGSTTGSKFLYCLGNYYLPKKDSAPWYYLIYTG
jgi:hypothetical protein